MERDCHNQSGFAASKGSPAGTVWEGAEILPASRKVEDLS